MRIPQATEQRFARLRPLINGAPEMSVPQLADLVHQAWEAVDTGADPEPFLHRAELAAGLSGLADELRECGRCQEWIQPERWDTATGRIVWRKQCVYCGRKYTAKQSAAGTVAAASRRTVVFRADSPALFGGEDSA